MTDIVERLLCEELPEESAARLAHCFRLMNEAADTIEQLRKANLDLHTRNVGIVLEIERLRSLCGKADVGQSFAEVTKDMRHAGVND